MEETVKHSIQTEADAHSELPRRKNSRFNFKHRANWDFFTSTTGRKLGYLENISVGGCLLRTTDPIEHRRWIRLLVREPDTNFLFTAVGRVLRREDRLESWESDQEPGAITLHRYGVEFVQPLNTGTLERIQASCTLCASCGATPARIADKEQSEVFYCVLCHLRGACQNLISETKSQLPHEKQRA